MDKIFNPDFYIELYDEEVSYNGLCAMGPEMIGSMRERELKKSKFHENAACLTGLIGLGLGALAVTAEMESIQMTFAACASAIFSTVMGFNIYGHRRHTKNATELDQAFVVLTKDAEQAKCEETNDMLVAKGVMYMSLQPGKISYHPTERYEMSS